MVLKQLLLLVHLRMVNIRTTDVEYEHVFTGHTLDCLLELVLRAACVHVTIRRRTAVCRQIVTVRYLVVHEL